VYRNWRAVLADDRLNRLKLELRLPYALQQGSEPGLWKPSDVKVTKADQTFGAKLRNLGSAVGVVGPTP
jgi:hypothetical protein